MEKHTVVSLPIIDNDGSPYGNGEVVAGASDELGYTA